MTTTACPNCGKPLRRGAKFCGSCGNVISATSPQQPAVSPTQPPAGSVCPKCKKPLRAEAKFCNNCGQPTDQAGVQPMTPPARAPERAHPAEPAIEAPEPQMRATAVRATPQLESKPPRRRRWLWLLVGLLVVFCVLTAAGAFLYFRDPFYWRATATPVEPAAPLPTETVSPTTTVAASLTYTPSQTDTALPSASVTSTDTITSTATPTGTLAAPIILLEDDFSGTLNINWKVWGNPRPKISSGPGDSWLELTASDDFASAGVTSKKEIPPIPGIEFEFVAQLNKAYPQYVLVFNWDPVPYDRGPEIKDSGVIHIEIRRDKLVFGTQLTKSGCEVEVAGAVSHTYLLRIVEGQGVELYLDGQELPICQSPSMGLEKSLEGRSGRISFTGVGWVTGISVSRR